MKVLLVGHPSGLSPLLKHLPKEYLCGIIGAGNRPQFHAELTSITQQLKVPLWIQPKASDPHTTEWIQNIQAMNPTILLCYCYSMLLPDSLLSIPKLCINCHCGWVPYFRGANSRQYALIHNSQKHGVTLHKMSAALDQGDTLCVETFPISSTDTWLDLQKKDQVIAEKLWETYLPKILREENLSFCPQDETQAKTYPHRKPEDGQLTQDMNLQLLYNTVRALVAPLPGAFWERDGDKIEIWDQFIPLQKIASLVLQRRPYKNSSYSLAVSDKNSSSHILSLQLLSNNGTSIPLIVEIEENMRLLKIQTTQKNPFTQPMKELLSQFFTHEFPLSQFSFAS